MSKTLALLLAASLAATSAMPALAGGLDDAIIEAPIDIAPAPAPRGLGGLGAAGAVVGGLVALGIIAAVLDDNDEDDDDNGTTDTLSAGT